MDILTPCIEWLNGKLIKCNKKASQLSQILPVEKYQMKIIRCSGVCQRYGDIGVREFKWRRTDFITSEKGVVSLDNNLRRVVVEKIVHLQQMVDEVVKDYTLFLLR
ncbi:MAG: hypothetical protein KF888_06215 [Nitrosomonas sp.]|nr:hypothetical protein [Nitrosomonas sp.]